MITLHRQEISQINMSLDLKLRETDLRYEKRNNTSFVDDNDHDFEIKNF